MAEAAAVAAATKLPDRSPGKEAGPKAAVEDMDGGEWDSEKTWPKATDEDTDGGEWDFEKDGRIPKVCLSLEIASPRFLRVLCSAFALPRTLVKFWCLCCHSPCVCVCVRARARHTHTHTFDRSKKERAASSAVID